MNADGTAPPLTPTHDTRFFGHPLGLATLFFTEMWERFSFYGMRGILLLFLTAAVADGGLGFSVQWGASIYAIYTSSVYLLGLLGGWLADRFLGQRKAVFIGGVFIALGHFVLIVPSTPAFFLGLVIIASGVGLLKTNVSVIVGQLYPADDPRRDAGFSIFYMGINVGALAGPLVTGFLGEGINFRLGFGAAGVGMVLGLIQYIYGWRWLGDAGLRPTHVAPEAGGEGSRARAVIGWTLGVVIAAAAGSLIFLAVTGRLTITPETISNFFGVVLLAVTVGFFAWLFLAERWSRVERGRLATIVVLFVAAGIFWGAYEQAGSSLTLFARDATDRMLDWFDYEFPASWFQPVPALFVIVLAPVFAWLWIRMGSRQPSSPAKFAWGLVFVGLGFVVMMMASTLSASGQKVSPWWLITTYLLHVIGEMCLSPVGLSTVTKLAPERVSSLMMGVWFLAAAVGNYVGGRAAGFYESLPLWQLFGVFAGVTILAGVLLALLVPLIKRLMGGVH
jgi:POT family proton-dependent oligopeptide transporter